MKLKLALMLMCLGVSSTQSIFAACNIKSGENLTKVEIKEDCSGTYPGYDHKKYYLEYTTPNNSIIESAVTWSVSNTDAASVSVNYENQEEVTVAFKENKMVTLTAEIEGIGGDCKPTLLVSQHPGVSLQGMTLNSANLQLPQGQSQGNVTVDFQVTFDTSPTLPPACLGFPQSMDGDYLYVTVTPSSGGQSSSASLEVNGIGGTGGVNKLPLSLSQRLAVGDYTLDVKFYHSNVKTSTPPHSTDELAGSASANFSVTADIDATFKATASNNRSVKDGETLLFADDGKSRSVTFDITTNDSFIQGYPTWSGVTAQDGSTSATASIKVDKTVTTNLTPNQSKEIKIDFQDNDKTSVNISFTDGSAAKAVMDKLNYVLGLLKFKSTFSAPSESFKFEYEKVDKYNDGKTLGWKYSGKGSVSTSIGKVSSTVTVPTSVPTAKATIVIASSGLEVKVSGSGTHDESLESPGSANLDISATTTITVTGALTVAYCGLKVDGSVGMYAQGGLKSKTGSLYLEGKAGCSDVEIQVSAYLGSDPTDPFLEKAIGDPWKPFTNSQEKTEFNFSHKL